MGYVSQAVFHKQNQRKIYKAQHIKNTKWSSFYRIYASRKTLVYTNLFSRNDCKNDGKIRYKCFKD